MKTNNVRIVLQLVSALLLSGCASPEVRTTAPSVQETQTRRAEAAPTPEPQPKPQPKTPKYVRQSVEAAKPVTDADVAELLQKIVARISPFTLDEVRKGIPSGDAAAPASQRAGQSQPLFSTTGGTSSTGGSTQVMRIGTTSIGTTTRKRNDAGKVSTVSAYTVRDGEKLLRVEFNVKEGEVGLSDYFKGTVGKKVLVVGTPDTEQSNAIGFREAMLVDDEVYSLYRKGEDSKWSVEKFKMIEEQQ